MKPAREFLKDLRREIEDHPAVNHLFLQRVATAPFSREDYRVLAENHLPLVSVFTSYLETLLVRAPDSTAKLWLAKVLVDEYGEGSDGDDHTTLYGEYLRAAGGDPKVVREGRILPPARSFIATHRDLVENEAFLVGLGAVGPGHEWAIPKMFDSIVPGLRRAGFSEEEIGYFTLHLDQDQDHADWLEEALATYAGTAEAQEQIRFGALASLEARHRFWTGVQNAVMVYRQPKAARPDARTPRGTVKELFLTAWDFAPGTGRFEAWRRSRSNADAPTLESVLENLKEVTPAAAG